MKKKIMILLISVFALTGCDQKADSPSGTDVLQSSEPIAVQENESSELGGNIQPIETEPEPVDLTIPIVYMTEDISPEGLMAVYEALGWVPSEKVAVKLSTGEPPASNYLRPELIADLVQSVEGTIRKCRETNSYGIEELELFYH